ncbi:GNAT family N-acetyltransferase [Streptomyces sp. ICBB 8177]|uniref:GNAT family N-acetyltransferase n=1 Tax=Streptomyces sp. ICBB 8177 TaxID=563922 RepID=UPI000D67985E|nr:GNAT family N-acetyltransferase [Streptomyces sp. ICBB 8177]PWI45332.1 GNAT family N-acetyltransferase [Streptomyces sp. ICBB 8177]
MASLIPPVVPPGRMSAVPQPTFELNGTVRLRPWRERDAPALVEAARQDDIRHWNRPSYVTLDDARDRVEAYRQAWTAERSAIWAIVRGSGDEERAVGLVGLGDFDLKGGSAEILYWLLPEGRGGGLAVKATVRVSRWALDDLGLHRLRITHSTANPASCQVATRAGVALEGTMRSALLHADGWHDEHLHARVRGDRWP